MPSASAKVQIELYKDEAALPCQLPLRVVTELKLHRYVARRVILFEVSVEQASDDVTGSRMSEGWDKKK